MNVAARAAGLHPDALEFTGLTGTPEMETTQLSLLQALHTFQVRNEYSCS
jgi:hypothetical protein